MALEKIKQELYSAPVLSYYDPDPATTTILQCDASQKGVGAWIRQIDSNGKDRIDQDHLATPSPGALTLRENV